MKIYLAARYGRREEMCRYRVELQAIGVSVTSRWLNGNRDGVLETVAAREDIEDIRLADTLIAFTEHPEMTGPGRNRGGRHVEMGYALALSKPVIVCGHLENVFCYLPNVSYFSEWPDLFAELCRIAASAAMTIEPT